MWLLARDLIAVASMAMIISTIIVGIVCLSSPYLLESYCQGVEVQDRNNTVYSNSDSDALLKEAGK